MSLLSIPHLFKKGQSAVFSSLTGEDLARRSFPHLCTGKGSAYRLFLTHCRMLSLSSFPHPLEKV
jgi:hypothetical protein